MLEHVKLLKEAFDKRNNELWWNCNQVYFLADISVYVPEEIEGTEKEKEYCDLSKSVNSWFLEPVQKDYYTYDLMHKWSGLAEYLHKDEVGFDKNEVPLIKYEVTDDNKILITCFVDKDLPLDSKPENCYEHYSNLTVVQRLEDWLDGQIGDGWGENGFLLGFFIGEPKEVYIDNFYQVKKAYERESLDWHWEKV